MSQSSKAAMLRLTSLSGMEEQMRLPGAARHREPFRFNITPMIDVVFLLIIFFLVASYFIRSEQSRSVNLPSAGHGERDEEQSAQHLTITLEPNGQYSIAGQPCTEEAILNRLRQLSSNRVEGDTSAQVRIRADRKAHFAEIRRLIELCSSNQIVSIRFAVTTQTR